jgi:hypothetical protein
VPTQLPENAKPLASVEEIQQLRVAARDRGVNLDSCTDHALAYIVEACGDVELAADAVAMSPRPKWVQEFIGP